MPNKPIFEIICTTKWSKLKYSEQKKNSTFFATKLFDSKMFDTV
jgi:hypothetical protein